MLKYILTTSTLLLFLSGMAQSFVAIVDKNSIAKDDQFKLILTVENANGNINPPDLKDFRLIFGPAKSTNYQFVNGQASSSISFTYTLQPRQEGTFTIAAFTAETDKGTFKSKPITVKVGNKTQTKEISTFNFELGEYFSIKDHPKSKGVDLKLKVPEEWEIKEGDRPNIVKKFVKDGNAFLITVDNYPTFVSKKDSKELFENENFWEEVYHGMSSFFKTPELVEKSVVTIDNYPSLHFIIKGTREMAGIELSEMSSFWFIFYEDKTILLHGNGIDNDQFNALRSLLFTSIINSVIFPEQYD